MERYCWGNPKLLAGKPVSVPLCPLQIPYKFASNQTRVSVVRIPLLTAWAIDIVLHSMMKLDIYINKSLNILSGSSNENVNRA
jgi:hypothetical protein